MNGEHNNAHPGHWPRFRMDTQGSGDGGMTGEEGQEKHRDMNSAEGHGGVVNEIVAKDGNSPRWGTPMKVVFTTVDQRTRSEDSEEEQGEDPEQTSAWWASLPRQCFVFEHENRDQHISTEEPKSSGESEGYRAPHQPHLQSSRSTSPSPSPASDTPPLSVDPWTSEYEDDDWMIDEGSTELQDLVDRVRKLDQGREERALREGETVQIGTKRKFLDFPLPTETVKRARGQGHPVYWEDNTGNWSRFEMPIYDDISPNMPSLKWDGKPIEVVHVDRNKH
jgi:hypothetical protein